MYILHPVWRPKWCPVFSTISRYITWYPLYNFADRYIADIRYLKTAPQNCDSSRILVSWVVLKQYGGIQCSINWNTICRRDWRQASRSTRWFKTYRQPGSWGVRSPNENLVPYHRATINMAEKFKSFYINHVSYHQNAHADALASLSLHWLFQPKQQKKYSYIAVPYTIRSSSLKIIWLQSKAFKSKKFLKPQHVRNRD